MTDQGPQHGSMTSDQIRDARSMYDALREGTYRQAGAQQASYQDADAVVREWRRLKATDAIRAEDVPLRLWASLEALADGWGS